LVNFGALVDLSLSSSSPFAFLDGVFLYNGFSKFAHLFQKFKNKIKFQEAKSYGPQIPL
jgi:hypothetical protein